MHVSSVAVVASISCSVTNVRFCLEFLNLEMWLRREIGGRCKHLVTLHESVLAVGQDVVLCTRLVTQWYIVVHDHWMTTAL